MKPSYEELEVMLQNALDKIKASQEQAPFKFCDTATGRVHDYAYDCEGNAKALYLEPVIPPELAELQRENAELTRKLAAHHSQRQRLKRLLVEMRYDDACDEFNNKDGEEELRKLLEESKVPEWTCATDELPAIGQRVILCINGVVQHETYIFDAADKSDFYIEYFWSRPELEEGLEISAGQFWMALPQPKEPKP